MIRVSPSFTYCLANLARFSEERNKRASHHRSNEGHNYEHGEDALGKNTHVVTNVKRDEFHQSPRVHQRA